MKAKVINVISKEIDNGIAKNDKSLTIRVNKGEGEYVVNKAIIDNIDGDNIRVSDIDYEDIYDNIDDYEYPYNHVNRSNL